MLLALHAHPAAAPARGRADVGLGGVKLRAQWAALLLHACLEHVSVSACRPLQAQKQQEGSGYKHDTANASPCCAHGASHQSCNLLSSMGASASDYCHAEWTLGNNTVQV
jgi:hypothetical protein